MSGMAMKMGVVADDITGSNDIGIMFAKGGMLVHVYSYSQAGDYEQIARRFGDPGICILDTNSRLDAPELAYRKVFNATRELHAAGCRQFFNKTCSVFRGNIGAEFDAMLDALGQEFAVVVLGFPKNGRKTVDGIHYVHGRRLEESEFRTDPIHPMTRSDLVGILQSQTQRKVGRIGYEVIDRGPEALRVEIQAARARCSYVILDVLDQGSLHTIAQAVRDEPVLCGSSALAEELPAVWGVRPEAEDVEQAGSRSAHGILCISGSLMPQTAAQIQHLQANGVAALELNTGELFAGERRRAEIARLVDVAVGQLVEGRDVLVHSPILPGQVAETRRLASEAGLSPTDAARMVTETLAEAAAQITQRTGQNRVVVAGGETSAAVCTRMGVKGLQILREIQPGLPSCLSLSDSPIYLVLKSGSFGSPSFLSEALDHLRRLPVGESI